MELAPGHLVLVRVNVPDHEYHKIAGKWEQGPYQAISQLENQLVFRVQEIGNEENVRTLHHNVVSYHDTRWGFNKKGRP